jgi:shikimate dehydrogenase
MEPPDEEHGLDIVPIAGLLGHEIGDSLSPLLHSAADSASGRNVDYQLFDILPTQLDMFLSNAVDYPGLIGFNVTAPHKETVAQRLDAMHESARQIGAVNTVAIRGEHLIGYNTDRPAIASVIRAEIAGARLPENGWTVVLLGAGGAARAITWAVLDVGMVDNLIVTARNEDRVHLLGNDAYFAYSQAAATFSRHAWLDWATLIVNPPAMLINATPLGSSRLPESWLIPSKARLSQFNIVLDLAYNPPETDLMKAAREAGCIVRGGGAVLVEQAIGSRAIWLGQGKESLERAAMVAAYISWVRKVSRATETRGEAPC